MAETISSGRGRRRDSKGELPEHDPEAGAPPRAGQNIATEQDMQRAVSIFKSAERTYEAFLAEQRDAKNGAKAVRDKALADSVVMVASRGINKKLMRKLYERSNLESDALQAEVRAEVWAMRAAGLPVGSQLAFFEEEFTGNDQALRQAYTKGRDAYAEKRADSENPFHPSSEPGQRWLSGFADAQADVIRSMAPKAH